MQKALPDLFTFTRASPTVFDGVSFPAPQSSTESVLEVHSLDETLKAMIIVSSAAVDQLGACDNGTTDPFANMLLHVTCCSGLQWQLPVTKQPHLG